MEEEDTQEMVHGVMCHQYSAQDGEWDMDEATVADTTSLGSTL